VTDDSEDSVLVRRVVEYDDRRAFDSLVRRHQSALRNWLRTVVNGDHALADDLAQDTFIRAYRALSRFRRESRFQTWLYRIAWRLVLTRVRTNTLETEPLSSINEPAYDPLSASQNDSDRFRRAYNVALLRLSREQRMAIHLALELGFTQTEVADVMGLPLGTVKSHLQRGRLRLATLLAKWEGVRLDGN
jgi:RNA polymerase sigma-70 factor (ECF subfamily)